MDILNLLFNVFCLLAIVSEAFLALLIFIYCIKN